MRGHGACSLNCHKGLFGRPPMVPRFVFGRIARSCGGRGAGDQDAPVPVSLLPVLKGRLPAPLNPRRPHAMQMRGTTRPAREGSMVWPKPTMPKGEFKAALKDYETVRSQRTSGVRLSTWPNVTGASETCGRPILYQRFIVVAPDSPLREEVEAFIAELDKFIDDDVATSDGQMDPAQDTTPGDDASAGGQNKPASWDAATTTCREGGCPKNRNNVIVRLRRCR